MAPRPGLRGTVKCMILVTFIYVTIIAKYATYQPDTRQQPTNDHYCPRLNQSLRGATDIDLEVATPDLEALERLAVRLKVIPGGSWTSPQCPGGQRVAVIVPYRDRWRHLSLLLTHLHPFLQRQHATYTVFVVEQAYNETFNKGLIMNAAFAEVMKQAGKWDCVIFHDVDMVPQNDRNLYVCGNKPRHLSPALDNMRYMLMYPNLVGGVLALTPQQMLTVNGYSNLYWGWGAEDDDMSFRILNSGYDIERPPSHIGRYKMASHPKREMAENRVQLLAKWSRFKNDGVNSLGAFHVKVLSLKKHSLYTNITVDIGSKPARTQRLTRSNWAWLTDWLVLWKMNI